MTGQAAKSQANLHINLADILNVLFIIQLISMPLYALGKPFRSELTIQLEIIELNKIKEFHANMKQFLEMTDSGIYLRKFK